MLNNLSNQQANVLIAKKKDATLGACLIVQNDRICHLELTGEYSEFRGSGAMQALVWKAILGARENGCSEFSFGRTTLGNDGLMRYKKRWGTMEEDLSTLHWKPNGNHSTTASHFILESITKFINHALPRSLYKRFGSFVYNHWG